MAPPTAPLNLDVEAISGICGSISIACWVVVFSPQILENFRRSSAEGLSVQFIIVWLLGDMFNILGAVMQHVLPTMIILAIYYTIADFVLLAQCFYYRGFTWRDDIPDKSERRRGARTESDLEERGQEPTERSALLHPSSDHHHNPLVFPDRERRGSDWSANLSHLSPAVPLVSDVPPPTIPRPPPSQFKAVATNALAILMVCAAGVAGWWLSRGSPDGSKHHDGGQGPDRDETLTMDPLGQVFGWLCAVLYLGSRLPQLLLNWRRKSTEGVSMLFFLFACLGNLTYVLSILAYEPRCEEPGRCRPGEAAGVYGQYVLVNLSWLAGSAGTLLLDLGIFVQFFMYNKGEDGDEGSGDEGTAVGDDEDGGERGDADIWDQRPILERNASR